MNKNKKKRKPSGKIPVNRAGKEKSVHQRELFLVTGGAWHDFDGFTAAVVPVLKKAGWCVRQVVSDNELLALSTDTPPCMLIYTSRGGATDNQGRTGHDFTPEQVCALDRWVAGGGGLVAVHSATVDNSNPAYQALIGGRFVSHPEPFTFTVLPMARPHPITEGVEAFDVRDEFYVQEYGDDIAVHMCASYRDRVFPAVWSRRHGKGRVAYIVVGHFPEIWASAPFKRLLTQAVSWVRAPN